MHAQPGTRPYPANLDHRARAQRTGSHDRQSLGELLPNAGGSPRVGDVRHGAVPDCAVSTDAVRLLKQCAFMQRALMQCLEQFGSLGHRCTAGELAAHVRSGLTVDSTAAFEEGNPPGRFGRTALVSDDAFTVADGDDGAWRSGR